LEQTPTVKEAIGILRKVDCSNAVIQHCKAVSELAVDLGLRVVSKGIKVNLELVRIGALLHDIGRSKTHSVDHGIIGAEILASLNISNSIIRIVERHVGSGIPIEETTKLGLPKKDLTPKTIEEKIVSYADKLIDGKKRISFNEAVESFAEEFGNSHAILDRFKQMHCELGLGE